ncbi:MAG: SPFH/Band 7/PHB domain protein [Spirochaetaceae bacterium]|nr:SPFH/Band 7/PHB domain protein [Spirochaetaceae bacterium]
MFGTIAGIPTPVIIIIILFIAFIASCIKIVPQAQAYVIERLGAYLTTWQVGLHWKWPIVDRIARIASLKEQIADFPPQPVITKDNVTMQIDTIVFFQITDPKLYAYGVAHPLSAIENLTTTTLRNIVGELELDESLTSRDIINTRIRSILDEATDPWGIRITRVELRNIMPPRDIQDSMEKQMRAERERRQIILQSEGEKKSSVLLAEGQKQATILRAEADKAAVILAAEAKKEAAIREAEGEAEAIKQVQLAIATGLDYINKVSPSQAALTLKALETLGQVAEGQSTKLIIPSEIQSLAGLASSLTEIAKTTKN